MEYIWVEKGKKKKNQKNTCLIPQIITGVKILFYPPNI